MRELMRIQKPPKGVLEQIASAWGFTNPHRFSRLFKAQFDLSPQEALRAQAPAAEHENSNSADYWASATRLRDWLDHRPGEDCVLWAEAYEVEAHWGSHPVKMSRVKPLFVSTWPIFPKRC
jgi:hypothetical protein